MANYLVVGGSSGIGAACVKKLSESGHQVWATWYKNAPVPSEQVQYVQWDVRNTEAPAFLPPILDGVIYCPGSIQLKPFHRIAPNDFHVEFDLHVTGLVRILQAAYPALKKSDHAAVVAFSTVAVQHGFTMHTLVSAAKGALEGMVRALAAEWAPAIRVNAIAPGLTDTPLAAALLNTEEKRQANAQRYPLKRIGTAEDMAAAAVYLLSPASAWMTGEILHIDGGMSAIR